jgi:hypothetical protein
MENKKRPNSQPLKLTADDVSDLRAAILAVTTMQAELVGLQEHKNSTNADLDQFDERLREVEKSLAGLNERLTIFQLAQGAFTTVIGAMAALIGRGGL